MNQVRREEALPRFSRQQLFKPRPGTDLELKADLVLLAREELRDPYWAIHAARALGQLDRVTVPSQYGRAFAGARSPGARGQA